MWFPYQPLITGPKDFHGNQSYNPGLLYIYMLTNTLVSVYMCIAMLLLTEVVTHQSAEPECVHNVLSVHVIYTIPRTLMT